MKQSKVIVNPEDSPIVFKSAEINEGSDLTYLLPYLENSGIKIIQRDNKVFVRKKINGTYYDTLFENDIDFFKELAKTRIKNNFSNFNRSFELNEGDWKTIRESITTVSLIFTKKCNFKCKVCYAYGVLKPEEMSIDDIKLIFSKIGKNKKILLFGLEPTAREDLFEIIKTINEYNNFPALFTNGLRLSELAYVKKLKKAGIKEVFISFDGFGKEASKKIVSPTIQKSKLKALKNLKKCGIYTFPAFKFMEGKDENELSELIRFAIKNNDFIKGLFLLPLAPFGKLEVKQKQFFTYSDIIKSLIKSGLVNCDERYFSEYEKLKLNLYKILKNFGKEISIGSYLMTVPFKIENGVLKELIDTKDLIKVNSDFERGNFPGLLKHSVKFAKFRKFLINPAEFYYELLNKGIIYIILYNLVTDFNYIPFHTNIATLIKEKVGENGTKFTVNCT